MAGLYQRREELKRMRIRYVKHANFKNYLRKITQKVDRNASLSWEAVEVIDSIILQLFHDLAEEARNMRIQVGQRTLTEHSVHFAVFRYFRGEVARHAVANGSQAVMRRGNLRGV